jgi:adenosylcobinamide-phosphate synthase
MMPFELQLLLALGLDLLAGDPRWFPHPVRIIGFFCNSFERLFRMVCSSLRFAGFFTVVSVVFVTVAGTAFTLAVFHQISPLFAQIFAIFFLYTTVAIRDLLNHSKDVYKQLVKNDLTNLEPARKAVAMIVGRDTAALDRKGIIRATIETVAENMVDGITAPLFYGICATLIAPATGISPIYLAVSGAIGYKAVNTMDSMIAYKNERYFVFGKWAAWLDDLINFLPARISGILLVPAAAICGHDWHSAFTVFRQDRLAHASPNAAHTEATVAGALGIELGGTSLYFGKKVLKPTIGKNKKNIHAQDILRTNTLVVVGSLLFLILMLSVRILFLQCIQ